MDSTIQPTDPPKPTSLASSHHPATLAVHADDHLSSSIDVAPPIHLSTTFDYSPEPSQLIPAGDQPGHGINAAASGDDRHIYSRETAPNTSRLEAILTALLHAPSVTYSSGLAALFAAYTLLRPQRVAITGGYHGAHGVLELHTRLYGLEVLPLNVDPKKLQKGDVVHVETPVNPTGEARNLAHYSQIAKSRGAHLVVDATFGPPGLQDPFQLGADVVMHSGTKYLGGHSDMLCGVLATRNEEWYRTLLEDRTHLGSVMGSLEGWLGLRSVRTLELRVTQQSRNTERLVTWLHGCVHKAEEYECVKEMGEAVRGVVSEVKHASLQKEDMAWLSQQMPGGFGPVFAIMTHTEDQAKTLPSKLKLFHHATSLGGIESLIEWRAMSDKTVDRRLLRVSVGIESWEDLREDLYNAFKTLGSNATKI